MPAAPAALADRARSLPWGRVPAGRWLKKGNRLSSLPAIPPGASTSPPPLDNERVLAVWPHPEADAREVNHDVAGAFVGALDRQLVGSDLDEAPGARLQGIVLRGDLDHVADRHVLQCGTLFDGAGLRWILPRDREGLERTQGLRIAVSERADAVEPRAEVRIRVERGRQRRVRAHRPQRVIGAEVRPPDRLAEEEGPSRGELRVETSQEVVQDRASLGETRRLHPCRR